MSLAILSFVDFICINVEWILFKASNAVLLPTAPSPPNEPVPATPLSPPLIAEIGTPPPAAESDPCPPLEVPPEVPPAPAPPKNIAELAIPRATFPANLPTEPATLAAVPATLAAAPPADFIAPVTFPPKVFALSKTFEPTSLAFLIPELKTSLVLLAICLVFSIAFVAVPETKSLALPSFCPAPIPKLSILDIPAPARSSALLNSLPALNPLLASAIDFVTFSTAGLNSSFPALTASLVAP